jgi:hypothetical protein
VTAPDFLLRIIPPILANIALLFCAAVTPAAEAEGKIRSLKYILRQEQVNILRTIRAGIGLPYKPGGNGPDEGMDCSGFIYWVYRANGYAMPRSTEEQARFRKVRKWLAPGDILVFRGNGASGYHTGIYVARGWFAHAPGKGKRISYARLDASSPNFLGSWSPIVALRYVSSRWRDILASLGTKRASDEP